MRRKTGFILLLVLVLLSVTLGALADTASNSDARKGLEVREVSMHKYNSRTDKLGGRVSNTVTLKRELRNGWDGLCCYIKISNNRNYNITADLSLELTFPDGNTKTYVWNSTDIGAKWSYWYYTYGIITEPGTYVANWYIDDVFLIERTFYVK